MVMIESLDNKFGYYDDMVMIRSAYKFKMPKSLVFSCNYLLMFMFNSSTLLKTRQNKSNGRAPPYMEFINISFVPVDG